MSTEYGQAMARWRVLVEPAIPILLLASIVHAVRQNLFDLLLFTGTAALIAADAWYRKSRRSGAPDQNRSCVTSSPTAQRNRSWSIFLAALIFAGAVAPLDRDSVAMQIVLTLCGLVALSVVLVFPRWRPLRDGPSSKRQALTSQHGWIIWAALGVLACLWELTSFAFEQSDPSIETTQAHPSVSDLVGPLLAAWPGRAVFLLLWTGAGWWLLRRISERRPMGTR